MKNVLFLLFVLLVSISSYAQNNLNKDSKWIYDYYFSMQDRDGFGEIRWLDSTIIDDKKVLNFEFISIHNPNILNVISEFGLYEEEGKLYYVIDNEFFIMYDYNLTKGDTFIFRKPYEVYNEAIEEDSMSRLIVTEVDSIIVQGEFRKTYRYESIDQNSWQYSYVIEGIGDETFLFPGNWGLWDPPRVDGFRCYSEGQNEVYKTASTCYPVFTSNRELDTEIELNYNRIANQLRINYNSPNYSIQIFNTSGQQVFNKEEINQTSINLQYLQPGLYIVRVSSKSGVSRILKFIK